MRPVWWSPPYDRTLSYAAAPIAVPASVHLADPAALVPRPHPPRRAAPVRARRELFSGGQRSHDLRIVVSAALSCQK